MRKQRERRQGKDREKERQEVIGVNVKKTESIASRLFYQFFMETADAAVNAIPTLTAPSPFT